MLDVYASGAELRDLLDYWTRSQGDWFSHRPAFDRDFRSRFLALHDRARSGHLAAWECSPEGVLGLLILLDQFPRNAFRDTPRMYATDDQARRIARLTIERGDIHKLPKERCLFVLLPLSHSEDAAEQALSVALHDRFVPGGSGRARRHQDIIRRFGRFPHRNAILGRLPMPEEERYLAQGGFRG